MAIDPLNLGTLTVAIVTAIGLWITQRSAGKANRSTERDKAEIEAYNRARAMDLKTIDRQNEEIADLAEDLNKARKRLGIVEQKNENQQTIIRALRRQAGIPEPRSGSKNE